MTTDHRPGASSPGADPGGQMRARRWCLAANYHEPSDYGLPKLPTWTVYRDADGTLALGESGERFLAAGNPVRVRR